MAGGLKHELKEKHGIRAKVRHAYHELEVIVNGRTVFSYLHVRRIPTVEGLLELVEVEAATERGKPA